MGYCDQIYSWPHWLPNPQRTGFTVNVVDRRKKSEMEAGTLFRVEFDTDELEIQCTIILNRAQAAWFEAFEKNILTQGSHWFEFPIWVSGEIQRQMVRFKQRPKITQLIGFHTVYQLVLQAEERDLLNREMAEILTYFSPEELEMISDRLHAIMHGEAPGATLLHTFPEIEKAAGLLGKTRLPLSTSLWSGIELENAEKDLSGVKIPYSTMLWHVFAQNSTEHKHILAGSEEEIIIVPPWEVEDEPVFDPTWGGRVPAYKEPHIHCEDDCYGQTENL